MPEEIITYEYVYCGEDFDTEKDCLEHEDMCCMNPDYSEITGDAVSPLCDFCERCTKERYYDRECKMLHEKLPVRQCSIFTPARDIDQHVSLFHLLRIRSATQGMLHA